MSFLRTLTATRSARPLQLRLQATTAPAFQIPVIDFGRFRQAKSTDERNAAAVQVVDALVKSGFMVSRSLAVLCFKIRSLKSYRTSLTQYLSNHGIPQEEIDRTYAESAKFFKLPVEVKEPLAWKGASLLILWTLRGLVLNDLCSLQTLGRIEDGSLTDGSGSLSLPTQVRLLYPSSLAICLTFIPDSLPADEIAKMRQTAPDYKESMEIGRERDPGGVEPKWKNEWPAPGVVSLLYPSHPLQTFLTLACLSSSTRTSLRCSSSSSSTMSCRWRS